MNTSNSLSSVIVAPTGSEAVYEENTASDEKVAEIFARQFVGSRPEVLLRNSPLSTWLVMKQLRLWIWLAAIALALPWTETSAMAETNQSAAARWLAKADLASPFQVPGNRRAWENQRRQVRAQLWQILGKLPPRPRVPTVKILSREDKGDFTLEKFEFDNLAGSTVPGYLLLPKNAPGKVPAILYCHWHGGQYDIGKEELFRTNATPVAAGPALVKQGYAVIAIDAYCFGERNGAGPGGPDEKGSAGEMTASKFNLWVGRSLWGMIVRDDLMALDYLCSRPEIDTARVGVTGISMGAKGSRRQALPPMANAPRVLPW